MPTAIAYKPGELLLELRSGKQFRIPVAVDGKRVYVPCRYIATNVLGVDWKTQWEVLSNPDGRYQRHLREVPIRYPGAGMRTPLGLPASEAATWILSVNPLKVNADIRDDLEELQQELRDKADRLLWGDRAKPEVVLGEVPLPPKLKRRTSVVVEGVRQYRLACMECGAEHLLIDDGAGTVYLVLSDGDD
jgi:P22_AR N-terminal domain